MNRYDDQARLVFHRAREEANKLGHAMVGPEHLLLGLMREGGTAAQILGEFGMSLEGLRHKVEEIIGKGEGSRLNDAPSITPRARRVMELASAEARSLGAEITSTEHILLGIIREGDGVAYRILQDLTRDVGTIRWRILAHKSETKVPDLNEQSETVQIGFIEKDLESRVEQLERSTHQLEESVNKVATTFAETVNEIYQIATRDKPEASKEPFASDFSPSSAPRFETPVPDRSLEHRQKWLTNAPIGLTLFGLGLTITLEANNRKNAREPYFWLGTLGLVLLNAGLAFLGDAIKSRVLLELEQRKI